MADIEAARLGDAHSCPKIEPGPVPHVGGPICSPCSADVMIEDARAARVTSQRTGDFARCEAGGPDLIAEGSPNVFINDMAAARRTDRTTHRGIITRGASEVYIGVLGDARQYLAFDAIGAPSSTEPSEDGGASNDSEAGEDAGKAATYDLRYDGMTSWENQLPRTPATPSPLLNWRNVGNWWAVNLAGRLSFRVTNAGPSRSPAYTVRHSIVSATVMIELGTTQGPALDPGASHEFVGATATILTFPMHETSAFGEVSLVSKIETADMSNDSNVLNNEGKEAIVLVDPVPPTTQAFSWPYAGLSFWARYAAWKRVFDWADRNGFAPETAAGDNIINLLVSGSLGSTMVFAKELGSGTRSWRDGAVKGKGAFRLQLIVSERYSHTPGKLTGLLQGTDEFGEPNPLASFQWFPNVGYVQHWHATF